MYVNLRNLQSYSDKIGPDPYAQGSRIRTKISLDIQISGENNTFWNFFSLKKLEAGELSLRWNQIVPSLVNTFEKLKKLGYVYDNGEVYIIAPQKEDKRE